MFDTFFPMTSVNAKITKFVFPIFQFSQNYPEKKLQQQHDMGYLQRTEIFW